MAWIETSQQTSRTPLASTTYRSDRFYALLAAACLGALLALRLLALGMSKIDLVMDEAQYWTWSLDLEFGYFSKPPLIAWIIRGAGELCGASEFCVRAASPVLYTLSAGVLFATARVLFDARVAFWTAIVFATLPGVSYGSLLITTDAPLIFLWTLMLLLWVLLARRKTMGLAILLGLAIGVGLLAKQAMIYAVLCIACHALVSREARDALKGGRAVVAGLIAVAVFSPNIFWNAAHDFPTAKHTGANIGWRFPYIHPVSLVEFLGMQFAVFGPIFLAVLARASAREIRKPTDSRFTLLLSFSLPVLAVLVVQALLSRAHGNWAATAYPAASIFVTAVLLQLDRRILFKISLGLHLAIAAALAIVPAFARTWPAFEQLGVLRSAIGWPETAAAVRKHLGEEDYGALLVDTRELAAELSYYLRDTTVPLYAWRASPQPHNHYEMTRPFSGEAREPVLLVSLRPCPKRVARAFREAVALRETNVVLVRDEMRTLHTCRLSGYSR